MAYDLFGIELALVFTVLVPFIYLGATAIRRYLVRGHIWFHIDLPEGRTRKGHQKPDKKGDIHIDGRLFHTRSDCFTLVIPGWALPEAPFFRFTTESSWPLKPKLKARYDLVDDPKAKQAGASADGGKPKKVLALVGYESFLETMAVPAAAEEVFHKQKIFADAYGGRERFLTILFILMVIILIISFVILARIH